MQWVFCLCHNSIKDARSAIKHNLIISLLCNYNCCWLVKLLTGILLATHFENFIYFDLIYGDFCFWQVKSIFRFCALCRRYKRDKLFDCFLIVVAARFVFFFWFLFFFVGKQRYILDKTENHESFIKSTHTHTNLNRSINNIKFVYFTVKSI